jgi:3-hydroxyacyl-[acyl-carrier-protein] dehydratase
MAGDNTTSEKIPEKGSWEGVFYFQPGDGIYRDHFPGYPVVPGSLIVQAFLEAARVACFLPDYLTIENFRFREFLTPGHHAFRIELEEERLKCRICRGEKVLVSGVLRK